MTNARQITMCALSVIILFCGAWVRAVGDDVVTPQCHINEQEARATILNSVRTTLAAIVEAEVLYDADRPQGQELATHYKNLYDALSDDVPLVYNASVATVALGAAVLFFDIEHKHVRYIYYLDEPVCGLVIDTSGLLHMHVQSGKDMVWGRRRPMTKVNSAVFD